MIKTRQTQPDSKTSHRDAIYADYLARIQRGEIGRDARLVDTAIASDLGVSRMPVRDALMRLKHEGYLVSTTRGFMLPYLTPEEILEVFEIRRLLEPRAAAWAAQSLSATEIGILTKAVEDAEQALQTADMQLLYRASEAFRNCWISAVPNATLKQTVQRYLSQVQAVRMVTMRSATTRRVIVDGQKSLLDAFRRKDAIEAEKQMLRFVIAGENAFLESGAGFSVQRSAER